MRLTIEYDGTRYVGWQVQNNGPSIQEQLQRATSELLQSQVRVTAAGRTDSGVHALGQVVHFDAPRSLPMKAYELGLNSLLPDDIGVVSAEEVSPEFDARRWAMGKHYNYRINNRRPRSPMKRLTHWHVFQPLDVDAMREASLHLLGEHDFQSFRAADCQSTTTVRRLNRVDVSGQKEHEIAVDIEGTAFLKHMVRNIVGSLVEVGKGRAPPNWLKQVLEARDRNLAGVTAPAHGLTLMKVFYGDGPRPSDEDED
jgi:tRNA pseudouridine38-40 synthase